MRLFLSYSHADRKLAAELRKRLEAENLTVSSFGEDPGSASGWHQALEEAIRAASAILLLINDRAKVDDPQRVAWRLALEAVWADPSKRLIPILLQDAELPA
ncbi:MAG TPA: toll/interleukin-1 receptor domain-containing protein, partial [Thermoanaerobaculia bacterium]